MRTFIASAIAGIAMTTSAFAADYKFDPSHAQVLFSYNHLGFSTTYGLFSGFDGTATIDEGNIAGAAVKLEIKIEDMLTGWEKRDAHFKSADFFDVSQFPLATFVSKSVESTGDQTAKITGDLTIAGQTKEIVLDAKLNKVGQHPSNNKDWAGFDASTQIKRSDFGLGKFAPFVSDEVDIKISVELEKVS